MTEAYVTAMSMVSGNSMWWTTHDSRARAREADEKHDPR